jgi:hypothetical protein
VFPGRRRGFDPEDHLSVLGRLEDILECGSCDAGWQVAHYAESVR